MKRMEMIFRKLVEIGPQNKASAGELADALGLSRANVSSDLNKLWKEGKIEKTDGRPTRFSVKNGTSSSMQGATTFDRFAKRNKSLMTSIEQAKAAVLYPPRGMHCLILGETGVGKSMFAGLIHAFAVESGQLDKQAPFVVFNCADYANNPQLLISQLFGVKKGAYTGAEADRKGLLEKADGGILFLDEVHRLPAAGQEIFFTFMDKGIFRRVGESEDERSADVKIISATTENPDSHLLKTFIRRIPMVIKLPTLEERGLEERFTLIMDFFREESFRLNRPIELSSSAVTAFLCYPCPHNIGQLKTDIQLTCARVYADLVSQKKAEMCICLSDLPHHVKQGILLAKEHKQSLEVLVGSSSRCFLVHPAKEFLATETESGLSSNKVYEQIERMIHDLRDQGASDEELEFDIENYFSQFIKGVHQRLNKGDLAKIIDPVIINLVEEIVRYAEEKLNKVLSQRVILGLALHIQTSRERLAKGKRIINPQLNKVRIKYKKEFAVALECVRMIEESIFMDLPIDEAGYLTMFFVLDDEEGQQGRETVGVMVIMHGSGTATSMVDVANRLLVTDYAKGVDLPFEKDSTEILQQAVKLAREITGPAGLLLLVDMGSLLMFGELMEKELGIPVKVVSMASTPHVLEAIRKAMLGHSLEEVYRDVRSLSFLQIDSAAPVRDDRNPNKLVIVTACLTGEGSALFLKNLLAHRLRWSEDVVEIKPIQIFDKLEAHKELCRVKETHKVLCIVSNVALDPHLPHFNLEKLLSGDAIGEIQQLIELEETFQQFGETLAGHLKRVDGKAVLADVRQVVKAIEQRLQTLLPYDTLIGTCLHLCCLIERLKANEPTVDYAGKDEYIQENRELYHLIKNELQPLMNRYEITLALDEYCYIMNFFKHSHA